jgi:DNA-binding beta-propeller fold protein YncE
LLKKPDEFFLSEAFMYDRRRFIKNTGVALGGLALFSRGAAGVELVREVEPPSTIIPSANNGLATIELKLSNSVAWDYDVYGDKYALDMINNELIRYSDGNAVWKKGGGALGDRKLLNIPSSLASDTRGRVYVTDIGNSRVIVMSRNGRLLDVIRSTKKSTLIYPKDLAVANDRVYVADTSNHQIDIYDRRGRYKSSFGSLGFSYDDLNGPTSVAVGTDSDIFVVDKGNHGIKVFSHSGVLLDVYDGRRLGGVRDFNPCYIIMGPDGILYAADASAGNIIAMTQRGRSLDTIELFLADGSKAQPRYLSFSPNGNLIVSAYSAIPASELR